MKSMMLTLTCLLMAQIAQALNVAHKPQAVLLAKQNMSEAMLAADRKLSQTIATIAQKLPDGPTRELLHSFAVCTSCSEFKRLGELSDGGYLTCMDGLEGNVRAAYSMGVRDNDRWSDDIYQLLSVPVNQFDCTVEGSPEKCAGCHFFQACLKGDNGQGGFPGKTSWTLQEALEQSGQGAASRASLLMKMDIEGSEWPILASSSTDQLQKFKQLLFEFHWLDKEYMHPNYLQAMQALSNAGFRVAHIHGNNYASMYNVHGYSIPSVNEVTFLLDSPQLESCLTNPELDPLDSANNPSAPELPPARLP